MLVEVLKLWMYQWSCHFSNKYEPSPLKFINGSALVYHDDILIFSKSEETMDNNFQENTPNFKNESIFGQVGEISFREKKNRITWAML